MLVGLGLGASAWWVWPYERGGEPVRESAASAPTAPAPLVAVAPVVEPADAAARAVTQAPAPAEFEADLDAAEAAGVPEDAFASTVEVVDRPKPVPRIEPPAGDARQERVIADPPHVAQEPTSVTARRAKASAAAPAPGAPRIAGAPAPAAAPAPSASPAPAPAAALASAPAPAPAEPPAAAPTPTSPVELPAPRAAAATPSGPIERPAPRREERREPAPPRVAAAPPPAPAPTPSGADGAEVRVKRTQWHPESARRSADLELAGKSESVREGDVVGEYVVTEIRPSGVVLTRDGETIERGIGQAP
jgi:hypothetical protein